MTTYTNSEIESLISRFEARKLPKVEWTHEAHLVVAIWYSLKYNAQKALDTVRVNITKHNQSVGTPNTDDEGYHETITAFWMQVARSFIAEHSSNDPSTLVNDFIASKQGKSAYPLECYSRDVLFSVKARHEYVSPDLVQ